MEHLEHPRQQLLRLLAEVGEPVWLPDAVMARIDADEGRFDVIVNNAGIAVLRTIEDFTTEDWKLQTNVNLDSVFYGTKRAVVAMRKYGNGGTLQHSLVSNRSCGSQLPAAGRLFLRSLL